MKDSGPALKSSMKTRADADNLDCGRLKEGDSNSAPA